MAGIERITSGENLIAIIIRRTFQPQSTEFVTTPDMNMQVGFIKYPAGGAVQPHVHLPIERTIQGTGEVLYMLSGKAELHLYDDARSLVANRVMEAGDLLILVSGGHGFETAEDTLLLEVKQGPYTGLQEKERFEP